MTSLNLYTLLNLPADAGREAISEARKKFENEARTYSGDAELGEEQIRKLFPDVCAAFDVLLDENARSIYDQQLVVHDLPGNTEISEDDARETFFAKLRSNSPLIVMLLLFVLFLYIIAGYML
jgi:DnaJ-class molecular chaperone